MVKLIIAKIMRERKQEVNEMNHVDKGKASTRFVVIGLLLGIFMAAMDNTIVATAMGSIVADLGSFDKFAWVTASYGGSDGGNADLRKAF